MPGKLRLILPHGVMLAASVFLYWSASRIDVPTGGRIGPDVWPKAIVLFMGVLCAYEIVKRLVAGARNDEKGLAGELEQAPAASEAEAVKPAPEPAAPERAHPMLYRGIALVVLYLVAVPWAGFTLSTFAFLWAFPLVSGFWRPGLALTVAAAGTATLAVIFLKVAYISLPLGVGPFQAISIGVLRLLGV